MSLSLINKREYLYEEGTEFCSGVRYTVLTFGDSKAIFYFASCVVNRTEVALSERMTTDVLPETK